MEDYKKEPGGIIKLQERNFKSINDDYVRFIRFAQTFIENAGKGILAYICHHGFITNPTFRGMRWSLLTSFDSVYLLDLHGNAIKGETTPSGEKDENVFDIKQGVSICIFIKMRPHSNELAKVFHSDLYGTRECKYDKLNQYKLSEISFEEVKTEKELFLFRNYRSDNKQKYSSFMSLTDLFDINGVGITTAHDDFVISSDKKTLIQRFETFRKTPQGENLYKIFNVNEKKGWDIRAGWKNLQDDIPTETYIENITYRPFDTRYIFYEDKLVWRTVRNVMKNFIRHKNIALILIRINRDDLCTVLITDGITDKTVLSSKDNANIFPLFLYDTEFGKETKQPNLKMDIVHLIEEKLGLPFATESKDKSVFTPIDLLDYIYAVLHSPTYREKYKEFLKIDFPRVPYPADQETFWKLVEIGGKLRECHLMQIELDTAPYGFIGDGTDEVVKPEYKNGRVYISKMQYFDNVPQAQWEQYIGGYQPLQKWLKDRKKTMLSAEDIEHYKKIIAALRLTEELMAEIDQVVEF